MRAVVQRVKSASVTVSYSCAAVSQSRKFQSCRAQVDGEEVSRIGAGVLCLIGIRVEDGPKDADFV